MTAGRKRQRHTTRRSFLSRVASAAAGVGVTAAARAHAAEIPSGEYCVTDHGAKPDHDGLQTLALQAAIDAAAENGGGTVRIPAGRYLSGALRLRDNIRMVLERDAILQGSGDWRDYGRGGWLDALLTARDASNIHIEGPGRIDGADCPNPKGEEGFRGPHTIVLLGCRGITIDDVTIARMGNYAMYCQDCAEAEIRGLSVRGGHDAVHAQACTKFNVHGCDFRTGDDCLAGCDNTDFEVFDCKINSSCNGFRLGCVNLLVKRCKFWGPGEHPHLVSVRRGLPRTNMLSAFVHFAPEDRNPKLPSDNWLVENCTIDNVDRVYGYDIERGGWQTGQPAKRLRFVNVKATGLARPLRVVGDAQRQFELTLEGVTLAFREDQQDQPLLDLTRFGTLVLRNATLENSGKTPALLARDGNTVWLDGVRWLPDRDAPYILEQIDRVRTARTDFADASENYGT
jgi:hypothetical protein